MRLHGRLGPNGRARVTLTTPLDGRLELSARGASAAAPRTVCGTRKTPVSLVGKPGAAFTLVATRP